MFGLFKNKQAQKIEPLQNWQQAYERRVKRDLEYIKKLLVEKQRNYIENMMSSRRPVMNITNYIMDALAFAFTRHHFDFWHNQHWPQELLAV